MPHLRLEYSKNIKETIDPKKLFSSCHQILVDTINVDILRCQSRAACCDVFHVGKGSSQEAFIYLEIKLMEGRTFPKLQELGSLMLKNLENYFAISLKELKVQMAVRIVELSSDRYFKIESNR